MDEENDLFYHALNYRGAASEHAELFWKELESCVNRLIAAEREACAKAADYQWVNDPHVSGGDAIRMRSNDQIQGPA